MERKEMRKNYLEKFIKFATYSDDLPSEKLESDNPNYNRYKCRNNFWAIISGRVQELLRENFITDECVAKHCKKYVDYSLKNAGKIRPTRKREIEYINKIINLVIG